MPLFKIHSCHATRELVYVIAILLGALSSQLSAADWKPTKNVEFIVPFAAGGGNDVPARIIQKIISEKKLIEVSSTVVNKPGGGGAIGLNYLNQNPGDGHYLSIISTSTLTSHILGSGKTNYTDVTPIVPLITEYIAFAVKADSAIQKFPDVLEKMKADPASVSFAVGGGLGNPNHVAIASALKGGVDVKKMKAVAFGGGKEALTAVMGGHVDVISAAADVLAGQVKGGKLRIIAIAAPSRLGGEFADVPTLKEQGINVVFGFSRYIVGPKGMTVEQTAFWEAMLTSILKTPEWKAEAARRNWNMDYMNSAATQKDLKSQYDSLFSVMNDLGMSKSPSPK